MWVDYWGGGQRVCWPPSQIIGGGGCPPPATPTAGLPLPTPIIIDVCLISFISNITAPMKLRFHTERYQCQGCLNVEKNISSRKTKTTKSTVIIRPKVSPQIIHWCVLLTYNGIITFFNIYRLVRVYEPSHFNQSMRCPYWIICRKAVSALNNLKHYLFRKKKYSIIF